MKYKRDNDEEEEETESPVQKIDNYSQLQSPLTVQQKNMFRDMGFEFAG
jgi:hypothetical protein